MPYWALILQLARKSPSSQSTVGVQACAPVSSSSTKFQCSLVALHFCIDDISLIFFQISFIVVKYTQNALSSPLTCKPLCILIVVQLPLLSCLGHVVCGHPGEYAYTLHRLPRTSHSQGRLSSFCYCVKCPGESNSVEKGFVLAQSCSSTVCRDRSQASGNWLASCAAVTRAMMCTYQCSDSLAQAPPTVRRVFPYQNIPLPGNSQRPSSQGVLDSVQLTTLTKHPTTSIPW